MREREKAGPQFPDLQALVEQHGSWPAIPPEAWDKHDAAARAWREAYRRDLPRTGERQGGKA